ncbi:TVP38/TMEM64 family protein [Desmospora profundinema]|uniref:TVP38/TMEM64 family membrane protein n=1 Tax=Desmospora profundinema TaxID=1571184 RepID=A0ABU1IJ80_9BACL|nr:VTT domain-containing protein [Desmospora profundinema]MDR6224836.1 putative membrane protein YdjX (TVP38/TMEM64 family) [Desmospora profundinema]
MTESFIQWLEEWGVWAAPASIAVNAGVNVIGFIPSVFVTGANVWIWGPFWGFWLSWAGEVLGAAIAFFLFRKGIRRWQRRRNKPDWRWIRNLNRWPPGRQFASILLARIAPMVPSGAVNLLGAFTRIRFELFLLATMIGKIPSIALEVLVSYDVMHFQENAFRLVTILTMLLLGWWIWRSWNRQRESE